MSFFLINVVVKICKPLSKLDIPTLRKGSIEERTNILTTTFMKKTRHIIIGTAILCIYIYIKAKVSYFLFVPLRSFLLCYPGEALEGPISIWVCKNSTMLIQLTTYKYEKLVYYIYIWMGPKMAPTHESIFILNIDKYLDSLCSK